MKYIVILTQEKDNVSVSMIAKELKSQLLTFADTQTFQVVIIVLDNVRVSADKLEYPASAYPTFHATQIPFTDIALVIKRTFGPAREKALAICKALESKQVPVLNGCDFIEWSHSKIRQYKDLENKKIIPKSVCFGNEYVQTSKIKNVFAEIDKKLTYPMVLKTSKGSRTDGVYLVESRAALTQLLEILFKVIEENPRSDKAYEIRSGFILQQYIGTGHTDKSLSVYYRVNIVDRQAQSAVQFVLQWQTEQDKLYKRLKDFDGQDKPVSLACFDKDQLAAIIDACPCDHGVVGADIILSDKLYLLEYNDGPVVSAIVNLANQSYAELISEDARQQCAAFPVAIAKTCIALVKSFTNNCDFDKILEKSKQQVFNAERPLITAHL